MHVLPTRTAGAAENMAADFLLLQRYPQPNAPRLRHYGWHRPAFTFGYSQKIAFVRAQLPAETPVDLCRRFTGGGVVDHRDDWTYALVIPRGHDLEALRAAESYRAVHEALAAALRDHGQPATTKTECDPPAVVARNPEFRGVDLLDPTADRSSPASAAESTAGSACTGPAGVCFTRAERYDVIDPRSGEKIAGAAQKRNRHGLILQGSLWRPAAPAVPDWDAFLDTFAAHLATTLRSPAETTPWPEFHEGEWEGLTETYASAEWIEQR